MSVRVAPDLTLKQMSDGAPDPRACPAVAHPVSTGQTGLEHDINGVQRICSPLRKTITTLRRMICLTGYLSGGERRIQFRDSIEQISN